LEKFARNQRERELHQRKWIGRALREPNTGRLWGPVKVVPLRSILERKRLKRLIEQKRHQGLTQFARPARKRA